MHAATSRTSASHPLRIAEVSTGAEGGLMGITSAPGKKQSDAMSGSWYRDLESDLDLIAAWNAAAVVTLVEPHELKTLEILTIGDEVRKRHMEWHHWPITDVSVPSTQFETTWAEGSGKMQSLLKGGSNVLIHCKGGLGRAGMIAARVLVQLGTKPGDAIKAIRAARPGAIETASQEQWVLSGSSAPAVEPATTPNAIRDRRDGRPGLSAPQINAAAQVLNFSTIKGQISLPANDQAASRRKTYG